MQIKKIAMVEKGTFGGTCLNVGCIPSKMFVLPGDLANMVQDSQKLNVHATLDKVDWQAVRDRVFNRIDPISESGEEYRSNLTNVDLYKNEAKFVDKKTLQVGEELIQAENILLAVGSRPYIPKIDGLANVSYHTSDSIMRLPSLPKRLGIIGGGIYCNRNGTRF